MNKYKRNQVNSKTDPERKRYFLRSVKVEETEGMSFPLNKKIKIENNSESPKKCISLQEIKHANNFNSMSKEMKKNISSDNTSGKLNKKVSKLHLVSKPELKLAKIKTENKKEHLNLFEIKTEDEIEYLDLFEIETENEKEHFDLPEFKTDENEVTISSKTSISQADSSSMQNNSEQHKRKQNAELKKKIKKEKDLKPSKVKIESGKPTFDSNVNTLPRKCSLIKRSEKSKQELDDTPKEKTLMLVKEKKEDIELFKVEEKEPAFKIKRAISRDTKRRKCKFSKTAELLKEDFKDISPEELTKTAEVSQEISNLQNVKEITEKADEILLEERGSEHGNDTEYEAFSNYFDVTIPLVGKNVFPNNNDKPFTKRYDLAMERNRRRCLYDKQTGIEAEVLKLIEEKNVALTDKKKYDMEKKTKNINLACYITELCYKILEELSRGVINEKKIIIRLGKFLLARVTPTCLLYVPHLVHTIAFIRGNKNFSRVLRLVANECYDKCHAMFPIPAGYNFETVYTSEMRKFLPDDFDKMENTPLDYGDIDDLLQSPDPDEDSSATFNNLEAE